MHGDNLQRPPATFSSPSTVRPSKQNADGQVRRHQLRRSLLCAKFPDQEMYYSFGSSFKKSDDTKGVSAPACSGIKSKQTRGGQWLSLRFAHSFLFTRPIISLVQMCLSQGYSKSAVLYKGKQERHVESGAGALVWACGQETTGEGKRKSKDVRDARQGGSVSLYYFWSKRKCHRPGKIMLPPGFA